MNKVGRPVGWRKENKITEDKKTYFREYMTKYNSEKIECGCGSTISKGKYTKHLSTKKHQLYQFKQNQ